MSTSFRYFLLTGILSWACWSMNARNLGALEGTRSTSFCELYQLAHANRHNRSAFKKGLRIPFEYKNGFIIVNVLIDGLLPTKLIFDTGSKHTILTNKTLLSFLRRQPQEQVRLIGSDLSEVLTGRIMRNTSVSTGEVVLERQALIILDEDILKLDVLTGENVYGILGTAALGAYAITIDYAGREIRLLKPEKKRVTKNTIALPLERQNDRVYLNTYTSIHSGHQDSLNFLIDTGASLALLIHTSSSDSTIYPSEVVVGKIGAGLGGALYGYVGRSDTLALGKESLEGVVTHFQAVSDSLFLSTLVGREGIIGNKLLDRFLVTMDFPNQTLYLTPRRNFKKKRAYDKAGLRLVSEGKTLAGLVIQLVTPNSPAARAGLQVGDRILKVNGIPTPLLDLDGVYRRFRQKTGKKIKLEILRDQQPLQVTFRLQDII